MSWSSLTHPQKTENDPGDEFGTLVGLKTAPTSEGEFSEDVFGGLSTTASPPTHHRQNNILFDDAAGAPRDIINVNQDTTVGGRTYFPGEYFKCPYCLINFAGNWKLIRHLHKSHSGLDSNASDENSTAANAQQTKITERKKVPCQPEKERKANTSSTGKKKNISKRNLKSLKRLVPETRKKTQKQSKCSHCGFTSNYSNIARHMKIHTENNRDVKCSHCPSFFRGLASLRSHENTVHGRQKGSMISCGICGKNFPHYSHLEIHLRKIHGNSSPTIVLSSLQQVTKADSCEESINTEKNGAEGRSPTFSEGATISKKCGKTHGGPGAHIRNARRPKCQTCNVSFHSKADLRRHMKVHEEIHGSWKCSQCSSYFKRVTTLRLHENKIHNRKIGRTPCPCKLCGKIFWRPSTLKTHMNGVHRKEICHLVIPSPSKHSSHNLKSQLKTLDASEANNFMLQPCKVILTRCDRLPHVPTCSNDLMTRSTVDNLHKNFNNLDNRHVNSSLIKIRKEAGMTNFVCKICGKLSKYMSLALRHILIHTQQRPHECPDCLKTFRLKGSLEKHRRIHSGIKPFECPLCKKAFYTNQESQEHLLVHTGEKPVQCPHCSKRFTRVFCMRRHVKTIHSLPAT